MRSRTRIAASLAIVLLIAGGSAAAILGAIKTSIVVMAIGLIVCVLATVVGFFFG